MKSTSEPIIGPLEDWAEPQCMLHIRKSGMKSVRRRESVSRRRADQTWRRGKEQIVRPAKSPTLNMRKWMALNTSGCTDGFVDVTEIVMGGKTAWYVREISQYGLGIHR